jgi:beta-glucanase (GH16 family)
MNDIYKMLKLIIYLTYIVNTVYSSYCVPQVVDMYRPYYTQNITVDYNMANVIQENGNINLVFTNDTGGTRISLDNKIQYGTIDVMMKTSVGNSIVSAFVLFSDETKDEVDFEFVQNKKFPNQMIQTTFYYRGIPLYNVNDLYINTTINLAYTYNKYTFVWGRDFYEWKFNDKFLRRLNRNDTKTYPDSLSNVKISIWQHEPSRWSGPATNLKDGPFILSISSINITCQETQMFNNNSVSIDNFIPSLFLFLFIFILI